jgi:hypothetical protein
MINDHLPFLLIGNVGSPGLQYERKNETGTGKIRAFLRAKTHSEKLIFYSNSR